MAHAYHAGMDAFAALLVHVVLALRPGSLPPDTLDTALAEVAAIWQPYRVVVDAEVCHPIDSHAILITVVVARTVADRGDWRRSLGALQFVDGVPFPTVTVYLDAVARIVDSASVYGTNQLLWPAALRDRITGRVVGRVLAHEIGHYLLNAPEHAPKGLMQPAHRADDLVAPQRRRFELTREAAERLAATGGGERKGPADAGPER
jgi:hypothetical protein